MSNNIEEDIKIVSNLTENFENSEITLREKQAIENILDLVKDKTIHLSDKEYRQVIENAQKDIKQKYEDKIKNKIEEVEDVLDMCRTDGNVARYKMKLLEEEIENLKELL